MKQINLNNLPNRKRNALENTTVKALQDNLYDILQYIADDGFQPPNIEREITDLNTDAILKELRKCYDKNKRLKPQYKPMAGYLRYIITTTKDLELKKQLDKQKHP